jgi:hypothetical protein
MIEGEAVAGRNFEKIDWDMKLIQQESFSHFLENTSF